MQTYYISHAALVQGDKVYAIYVVKDQNVSSSVYRVYAKFGQKDAFILQARQKRQTVPSLKEALTYAVDEVTAKIGEGYQLIQTQGELASLLHLPSLSPWAGQDLINPIALGGQDDTRGLFSPDGTLFAGSAVDSYDWETKLAVPKSSFSQPAVTPNKTKAQVVVERTRENILKSREMIKSLCSDKPSPFPEDHPLIPPEEDYAWAGEEGIQQLTYYWGRNDRVLAVGPSGCGKTAMFKAFLNTIKRPMIRINFNGHVLPSELIGKYEAMEGSTVWRDGVLPLCMRMGYTLLADEIDMAEPGMLALLHPVLEPNGALLLKEHAGEVVTAHPEFRFFATANSLGTHDDQGIYTGTNSMNAALMDRFEVIESDYLNVAVEAALLCSQGHPYSVAFNLAQGAVAVREAIASGSVTGVLSTRRLFKLADAYRHFEDFSLAFKSAVAGHFSKAEAEVVRAAFQRYIRFTYASMPKD